jgi:hypothetical protein
MEGRFQKKIHAGDMDPSLLEINIVAIGLPYS